MIVKSNQSIPELTLAIFDIQKEVYTYKIVGTELNQKSTYYIGSYILRIPGSYTLKVWVGNTLVKEIPITVQ